MSFEPNRRTFHIPSCFPCWIVGWRAVISSRYNSRRAVLSSRQDEMALTFRHILRFMPVGCIVFIIRIQASSKRFRTLLSLGELSMIVQKISAHWTSWSRKCSATGESLFLFLISRLWSARRSQRWRPVLPMYCDLQTGQVIA